jgi:mono/diheme cytochrome c family protein
MTPTSTRRAMRSTALGLVTVVVALAGGACSSDDAVPDGQATSAGAELYEQSCASCHGTDLGGTNMGPPHLSQVYAPDHHPDSSFRAAITQGSPAHHWEFGDMPPVEGLDDEEIDSIIAYVREQQVTRGLDPYPPG